MALKFGLGQWQQYDPRDDVTAPLVLCFGDSWFWYPVPGVGNLPDRFLDFSPTQAIDLAVMGEFGLAIAHPGRNALANLSTFMQWENSAIDMLLISGGGNDFTGADDLDPLLQRGDPDNAASWFKPAETGALLAAVQAGYERLRYLRDTFCPHAPIVTACYDYAPASGKGLLWMSPWIKPSLEKIGMPAALHRDAVRFVVDSLAHIQRALADGERYIFIDTRHTLNADDWSNELHPTGAGFDKIARRYRPVFARFFPDWIA